MTKCPCSGTELRALLNAPGDFSPLALELARRVLDARKRGSKENRYAGVSWSKRREEESAGGYLERVAEKALKREARAQQGDHEKGHTAAKGRRNAERAQDAAMSAEDFAEQMKMLAEMGPKFEWLEGYINDIPPQPGETRGQYFARRNSVKRERERRR